MIIKNYQMIIMNYQYIKYNKQKQYNELKENYENTTKEYDEYKNTTQMNDNELNEKYNILVSENQRLLVYYNYKQEKYEEIEEERRGKVYVPENEYNQLKVFII